MTGLRESKKRQTRATIAQAAADLFRERGFAAVTVDDVARRGQRVAPDRLQLLPHQGADALRPRGGDRRRSARASSATSPTARSLVDAFRRHTRGFWERFGETLAAGGETHGFWEIVRASPALRDYGEASFGRQAQRVGEEIARDVGPPARRPRLPGPRPRAVWRQRRRPHQRAGAAHRGRGPRHGRERDARAGRPGLRPARARRRRLHPVVRACLDADMHCARRRRWSTQGPARRSHRPTSSSADQNWGETAPRDASVRPESPCGLQSGRQDLNLRPPGPQPGALPDCATPRDVRR